MRNHTVAMSCLVITMALIGFAYFSQGQAVTLMLLVALFGMVFGYTTFWQTSDPVMGPVRKGVRWLSRYFLSPDRRYSATVPEITVNDAGQIISMTESAARILNTKTSAMPLDFASVFSGFNQTAEALCSDVIKGPERISPILLKVDTSPEDAFVQLSWLPNEVERVHRTAIVTDATELKSLESQFVQGQKMQALGQLAGGIAHDFNNILTAISGYCDLLLLDKTPKHPDFGDLHQISNNANRAADLVQHLLAFSRRQNLRPSLLNVNALVAHLSSLLNRLVGEKVTLKFNRTPDLPGVYADARQLEQVIMNLVVNARDAMPDGGTIEITTSFISFARGWQQNDVVIEPGDYLQIEISDTGVGIPKDERAKIFEPFYTTKGAGEGTGLGLSTVYGIMKQSGGHVIVDSTVGKGTSFTLYLPAAEHPSPVVAEPETPKRVQMFGLAGTTVLLVEDETPVRAFAARALAMQGIHVLEASSGEEALQILVSHGKAPDVVVSDVIMPGLNGPEWVKEARKAFPDLKVVFVSGYAEDVILHKDVPKARALFLPKPYSLKRLIEAVQSQVRIS